MKSSTKILYITCAILLPALFVFTVVFAAPPETPYLSGEILDPDCAPLEENCTVLITASTLTTPRTIGGVSFDGSANITVASATGGFAVSGGNLVAPIIIGGTSTTQSLIFQTTSGVGQAGANIRFLVGNNGATEAMTIFNSGSVGIGTTAPLSKFVVKGSGATSSTSALNIVNSADTSLLYVRDDGNIGMGIASLEAWDPNRVSLQLGYNFALLSHKTGNEGSQLLSNAYYNGTNWVYRKNGAASNLTMDPTGDFWFRVASSNTAGESISWTTAMSIENNTPSNTIVTDSTGVGIGGFPSTKLHIANSDLGNGNAGPIITLGRNINATNTGAGSVNFQSKSGTAGYVWQDAAGNLRIHTSAPSHANDTAGVLVGDQTSIRETKQDIESYDDYDRALDMVLDATLSTFRYKKEVTGYGSDSPLAKVRLGYIADEVDPLFMNGNSIDQVSVNGILLASVKALNLKIEQIGAGAVVTEIGTSYLQNFLGNIANGLTNLYAKIIHGERGIFKNEICLGEEGNQTCITKIELDALLENASISPATPVVEFTEEPTPTEEVTEEEIKEDTVEEVIEEIEEAIEQE